MRLVVFFLHRGQILKESMDAEKKAQSTKKPTFVYFGYLFRAHTFSATAHCNKKNIVLKYLLRLVILLAFSSKECVFQ
jgi:hypothetical protein